MSPSTVDLSSVARRITGMRLLSICLAGLWAAVAISVLIAYTPGGPFDLLVRAAIFGPVPIALAAVRWPPRGGTWQTTAAIAWLGLIAALLLVPLLGGVLETLRSTGRQALFPSAEVAYAGLLALGATCLYAAIGVIGSREPSEAPSRTSYVQALTLAVALTILASAFLGLPSFANELALRDRPQVTSRFGPTDTTLTIQPCESPPQLGGDAVLDGDATATIDGEDVAEVNLDGRRQSTNLEDWTATRSGQFGSGTVTYHRVGNLANITDALGSRAIVPADLDLADPRGLTVDGPVASLVSSGGLARVAEDRGIELIEEARSRHCRITIDGETALSASVLVRLLIDGSLQPQQSIQAWRGSLDWWVFADDEIGQATITIGGYPGDAWTSGGGLQASIVAHVTATDRTGSAIMPLVSSTPNP